MSVGVAHYPYAVGLWLVLLHGRAEVHGTLHFAVEIVDLDVEMGLHLLCIGALRPDRRDVVGFQLEAQSGAFVVRVAQPNPPRLSAGFDPAQELAVEVGQRRRIGCSKNGRGKTRGHQDFRNWRPASL